MATDLERLVVSLEARTAAFEKAMNRANGIANTRSRQIESRFASMNSRLNAGFMGLQRGIAAAFAGAAAARGAIQLIDTATRIENSLKVAGLAGEELERVYDSLRESALRNAAPLEALVTLYGRASLVQKELGVSSDELLSFTNNIALALRASGQSAQEASGALLQLSQALGSGVVRAEEFNSLLEGAPTILQAAAAGIKEAEGSVAKLRQIMLDGNLSSRALFDGIEIGSTILEEKVANSALTAGQAMENLRTRLIDVARDFDKGTKASALLADGIVNLGDGIADLAVFLNNIADPLQGFVGGLNESLAVVRGLTNAIADLTGASSGIGFDFAVATNNLTGGAGLSVGSSAATRVIEQTFEMIGKTPKDEALARALAGEAPPEPLRIVVNGGEPISVNDPQYKPPATSGGGGGGKSGADRFARALASQQQRIEALNRETELQRQLGIAVNDYGFALERVRAQIDLENAAKQAGLPLDDARRQKIDELATGYAMATSEAARLAEAQEQAKKSAEELADAGRQALDTIVDGLLEGKDAGEILNSVVKDLTRNLIQMGINAITSGLFGGGGSGGGFFPAFPGFASGTANTGGARGQVRGLVHGQEAVIPLPNGGQVPVDIRLPSLPSSNAQPAKLELHVVSDDEKFGAYVTDISGRVVAATAPGIAEQGATKAGSKLAGGDFDNGMRRRFSLAPSAKRR
jgi:tape measure domain-containing protein